ncbi:MAG: EpsI family protein [Acidobacteria bacterium OLB17]|nr:MAG: EpsI family protein [Acidobacteria bacterium OLB17]MCZ2390047.1 EpsI family protein [Acidobacteriota bacterium]
MNLRFAKLIVLLVAGAALVNWLYFRGENIVARQGLDAFPKVLGEWRQRGDAFTFSEETDRVLGATDYTMREYVSSEGKVANIYIGYYGSQKVGATYHSPQNCLPGAGWVMLDPQEVEITRADGTKFAANQFFVENGSYREVMIYWYEGRGRTAASEYADKMHSILDSILKRRTDGAMIRVMVNVGDDEAGATEAVRRLSAEVADRLSPFVPN